LDISKYFPSFINKYKPKSNIGGFNNINTIPSDIPINPMTGVYGSVRKKQSINVSNDAITIIKIRGFMSRNLTLIFSI
jgi:hypothetical protein